MFRSSMAANQVLDTHRGSAPFVAYKLNGSPASSAAMEVGPSHGFKSVK